MPSTIKKPAYSSDDLLEYYRVKKEDAAKAFQLSVEEYARDASIGTDVYLDGKKAIIASGVTDPTSQQIREFISANKEALYADKVRRKQRGLQAMMKDAPVLLKFLQDQDKLIRSRQEFELLSYSERISGNYVFGQLQTELGKIRFKQMTSGGQLTDDERARISEIDRRMQLLPQYSGEVLPAAAKIVGQMSDQALPVAATAAAGAALGAGIGAFGGPGGASVGAKKGLSWGIALGFAEEAGRVEAGMAYEEALKAGASHDDAWVAGLVSGAFNSLLEVGGVYVAGVGVKKLASSIFAKTAVEVASKAFAPKAIGVLESGVRAAGYYGLAVGGETATEIAQEISPWFFSQIAADNTLKNAGYLMQTPEGVTTLSERIKAIAEETFTAMLALGLPSGIGAYASFRMRAKDAQDRSSHLSEQINVSRKLVEAGVDEEFLQSYHTEVNKQHGIGDIAIAPNDLVSAILKSGDVIGKETGAKTKEDLIEAFKKAHPEIGKQLEAKLATNEDIIVDAAKYTSSQGFGVLAPFIHPHIRPIVEGRASLSMAEVGILTATMDKLRGAVSSKAGAVAQSDVEDDRREFIDAYNSYSEQTKKAGFPADHANMVASKMLAFEQARANRQSVSLKQWRQGNNLTIVRAAEASPAPIPVQPVQFTQKKQAPPTRVAKPKDPPAPPAAFAQAEPKDPPAPPAAFAQAEPTDPSAPPAAFAQVAVEQPGVEGELAAQPVEEGQEIEQGVAEIAQESAVTPDALTPTEPVTEPLAQLEQASEPAVIVNPVVAPSTKPRYQTKPLYQTKERQQIKRRYQNVTAGQPEGASDAAYLDAVRRGDMEEAQRMVDEAAKAAGFSTTPVFHGTTKKFTSFDPNKNAAFKRGLVFFTPDKAFAEKYPTKSDPSLNEEDVIVVSAYQKEARVFDPSQGNSAVEFMPVLKEAFGESLTQEQLDDINRGWWAMWEHPSVIKAVMSKYDAIVMTESGSKTIAAKDPSLFKSSDPVTYDDAGNVIPLSQRFRTESPDIRQSERGGVVRADYSPTGRLITLYREADFHDLIHELGHHFLQMLINMGTRESAAQAEVEDANAVLKFLGTDAASWSELDDEQQRALHEKFAYSWQQMLFQREVNNSIKSALDSFTNYLKNIIVPGGYLSSINNNYRAVTGQDLPSLQGSGFIEVMNQIFSVEQSVVGELNAADFKPLFNVDLNAEDLSKMGVDPEVAQKIIAMFNDHISGVIEDRMGKEGAMDRVSASIDRSMQNKQQRARADKLKELEEQEKQELAKKRIHRLRHFFLTGEILDDQGNVTQKIDKIKLNSEQAVQVFLASAREAVAELRASKEYLQELKKSGAPEADIDALKGYINELTALIQAAGSPIVASARSLLRMVRSADKNAEASLDAVTRATWLEQMKRARRRVRRDYVYGALAKLNRASDKNKSNAEELEQIVYRLLSNSNLSSRDISRVSGLLSISAAVRTASRSDMEARDFYASTVEELYDAVVADVVSTTDIANQGEVRELVDKRDAAAKQAKESSDKAESLRQQLSEATAAKKKKQIKSIKKELDAVRAQRTEAARAANRLSKRISDLVEGKRLTAEMRDRIKAEFQSKYPEFSKATGGVISREAFARREVKDQIQRATAKAVVAKAFGPNSDKNIASKGKGLSAKEAMQKYAGDLYSNVDDFVADLVGAKGEQDVVDQLAAKEMQKKYPHLVGSQRAAVETGLATDEITNELAEKRLREAIKSGRVSFIGDENGASIEHIAEMFGYGSGRQMINELVTHPLLEDEAAQIAEIRLENEQPALLDDDALRQDRAAAIRSRLAMKIIAMETMLLKGIDTESIADLNPDIAKTRAEASQRILALESDLKTLREGRSKAMKDLSDEQKEKLASMQKELSSLRKTLREATANYKKTKDWKDGEHVGDLQAAVDIKLEEIAALTGGRGWDEEIRAAENELGQLRTKFRSVESVTNMLVEAAILVAQEDMANMKFGDIKPLQFEASAAKARRESARYAEAARKAFFEGKMDEFRNYAASYVMAKRTELLMTEKARLASETVNQVNARAKKIRDMVRASRKKADSRSFEYMTAAQYIAAIYGFGGPKDRAKFDEAMKIIATYNQVLHDALMSFVDGTVAVNRDEIQKALNDLASGKPSRRQVDQVWRMLSLNSLDALMGVIESVWMQASEVKKLEILGKKMDLDEARNRVADSIAWFTNRQKPGDPNIITPDIDRDSVSYKLSSLSGAMQRIEHLMVTLDGGKRGAMWELIFDPIRSASAIARERHNSYISTYRSILKSIQHQIDKTGTIDAPELQDGRGMAELIGFLQHAGSESNLNAVLSTYGFTMEQFEKFLNRIQENGTVNKETFVAIQRIWNLNDSLLPDAARAYRERTNVAMNPVKRRTLKTKFGDFEGGYVPLMTDRDYQAALRDPAELSLAARGGKFINTMASSVFPTWGIDRVENRKDRPVMDVRINIAHAAQVINFIHIEPVVVNAAKILSRDEGNRVAAALDRYNPKIIDEILAPWLQRVLHQRTSQRGSLGDATDDMLSEIRRNASAGIMFANVINSLQNVTGLVVATTDVKIGYLAAALKNTIDMVASMDPWMKQRFDDMFYELQNEVKKLLDGGGRYKDAKEFYQKNAYFMQKFTQHFVDTAVYMASYRQAMAEMGSDVSQAEAVERAISRARSSVAMTQGSTRPEDIAKYEAGTPFIKMLAHFSSYGNMIANNSMLKWRTIARALGNGEISRMAALRELSFAIMALVVIPAALVATISKIVRQDFDTDDDDGITDDLMDILLLAPIREITGMVPVFGTTAYDLIAKNFDENQYRVRGIGGPVINAFSSIMETPVTTGKKGDKSFRWASLKTYGLFLETFSGLPTTQVGETAGYIGRILSGQIETPEVSLGGLYDVGVGLTTGIVDRDKVVK